MAAATLPAASASAELVLHCDFNGRVSDLSGAGNHGALINGADYVADSPSGFGQSLSTANGGGIENQAVQIAGSATLASSAFTLSYWIKPTTAQASVAGLERLTSRAGDAFETALGNAGAVGGTSSATGVTLSYYAPSLGGWRVTHVPIEVGVWTHVAWVNGGQMELFIDGVSAFVGQAVGGASPGGGTMMLGARVTLGPIEGYEGYMDELRLFNTALSAAEVAELANPPDETDADGDGLLDSWEAAHGLDPDDNGENPNNHGVPGNPDNGAAGDPDNDGLPNAEEFAAGTDPQSADTDGDGLSDGEEVAAGTDPLRADTDGDGLNDGDELALGTDPTNPDSDGDGLPDGFEVARGSDPLDSASIPALEDLLVLHLDFEGNVLDRSGTGNDGILLNDAGFSPDVPPVRGGAASLSVANGGPIETQGVGIAGSPTLGAQQFTLAYWIKPATTQPGGAGLERLTSRLGNAFETAIGDASAVGGTTSPSGMTLSYYQGAWRVTHTEIRVGEWAHVAWVNTLAGIELFLNGESVFTGPAVAAPRPGQGAMTIGTRFDNVEGYEGLLDDLRLYAAALDVSQIQRLLLSPDIRFPLRLAHDSATGELAVRWPSAGGKLYTLRSATDPSLADPVDWPVFGGFADLAATPPENSVSFPLPPDPQRFFVVEESDAPPMAVFFDDFESGQGLWTTGSDGEAGTAWEIGAPAVVGPFAAHSGTSCAGTNLSADYAFRANVWLRSPPIDLTTAGSATLRFAHFRDIEPGFDFGTISVLDAADDSFLVEVQTDISNASADWESASRSLPIAALGKTVRIDFRFQSDGVTNYAGWYLDDVEVTVP